MKKKISIKSASDIRFQPHQQIPEKISNQLDAWIAGESGVKNIASVEKNNATDISNHLSKQSSSDKSVRLNINLPNSVHHSLKLACLNKGMTITNFIKKLIENEIEKT
jgi:hypothetical protein